MSFDPSSNEDAISLHAREVSDRLIRAGLEMSSSSSTSELSETRLLEIAGVSPEDFQSVIGDMEAYLLILQLHLFGELKAAIRNGIERGTSIGEKLSSACNGFLDVYLSRAGAQQWLETFSQQSTPLASSAIRLGQLLARELESAIASDNENPQAAARLLLAAVDEIAGAEAVQGAPVREMRRAVEELTQSFLRSGGCSLTLQSI